MEKTKPEHETLLGECTLTPTFTLHRRQLRGELMDRPGIDPALHTQALRGLRRINSISRSAAPFWRALLPLLQSHTGSPLRILDIACGGGDNLLRLARRARDAGFAVHWTACDISPHALSRVAAAAAASGLEIELLQRDVLIDGLPQGYDVLLNALFLHHLQDDQVLTLLMEMQERVGRMLLISDLLRTSRGNLLAHIAPHLLSRSSIVHLDAVLSVHAAFTLPELAEMTHQAGLEGVRFQKVWPQRIFIQWGSAHQVSPKFR